MQQLRKQLNLPFIFTVRDIVTSKAFPDGAGIIGSSIALNLAKQGCKVTLLEASPHPASAASGESWAWLNANRKSPDHYRGKGIDMPCRMDGPLATQQSDIMLQTYALVCMRPDFSSACSVDILF